MEMAVLCGKDCDLKGAMGGECGLAGLLLMGQKPRHEHSEMIKVPEGKSETGGYKERGEGESKRESE